jgi:hypothetical protein
LLIGIVLYSGIKQTFYLVKVKYRREWLLTANTGLSHPSLRWGTLSIASDREGKCAGVVDCYPLYAKHGEGVRTKCRTGEACIYLNNVTDPLKSLCEPLLNTAVAT